MKKQLTILSKSLLFLSLAIILASCSASPTTVPAVTRAAVENAPTQTPQPVEQPTAVDTPVPQPVSKRVVLVAPAGSDLHQVQQVQQVLSELAGASQMGVETHEALQAADLSADTAVTVWLESPANLSELAASAPQTVFIVFTPLEIQAGANISVIRLKTEFQAFVGGFVAVLISPNWRAAGLLPADGPLGGGLADAFVNGGRYFCGVCAPGWPLGEYYPQVGSQPSASNGAVWQSSAASLFDEKKVDAYYLSAQAAKSEVITYLAGKDQFGTPVRVVGEASPPAELANQWAASVVFDLGEGLRLAWSEAAAGKGGVTVDAPVMVENVNPDHLGEGRLRLVKELIEEIKAGRIQPYTVPAQ